MTRTVTRRPKRPSRKIALTARAIAKLAPEAQPVDWFDRDTRGLALRVSPAGARTWYLFYVKGRTVRRVKLGGFPGLSLAKAREAARETRVRIDRDGADPAHERHDARNVYTVDDLAKLYLTQHAKAHKRTWRDDQWRLDAYILPAWRSRPVAEITRADVHALLDKIVADGKPIQANRVQALVSKLWNFAVDRSHATVNPCYRMAKRAPERARAVVLSDTDLRALWLALDAEPGDAADAIRLRLLTGQRGGEVHSMQWADLDTASTVWTIPATAAKNGRAHRVPLAAPAQALLEARRAARVKDEPRVFPGLYHQRDDVRALAAIHQGAYRWHDLRRTVVTRLAGLGFSEDIIGRVVNHAKRGITATIYNQHAYDNEKRQAADAWARELARVVARGRKAGAAVVRMRRA